MDPPSDMLIELEEVHPKRRSRNRQTTMTQEESPSLISRHLSLILITSLVLFIGIYLIKIIQPLELYFARGLGAAGLYLIKGGLLLILSKSMALLHIVILVFLLIVPRSYLLDLPYVQTFLCALNADNHNLIVYLNQFGRSYDNWSTATIVNVITSLMVLFISMPIQTYASGSLDSYFAMLWHFWAYPIVVLLEYASALAQFYCPPILIFYSSSWAVCATSAYFLKQLISESRSATELSSQQNQVSIV
jgi:hypothetical protein